MWYAARMKTHARALLLFAALPLAALAARPFFAPAPPNPMIPAAEAFLKSLPEPLHAKAAAPFADPRRTDWKFVPADRAGVHFDEMNDDQRRAARALLRSGLSSQGVLKLDAIVSLESVLHDLENKNPLRDPGKYVFMVFGTPGDAHGWGWKFEGHHVSVNFTLLGPEVVGATPMFMGSNPGEVRTGPHAGKRVLALEEDLARELVRSLTEKQRAAAVLSGEVPADVLAIPGRPLDGLWPATPVGLPLADLDPAQKELAGRLVEEFARNLRGDLADRELARIRADLGAVRFVWAGPSEPGRGHYYRLVGASFAVEYDNTQNNANHVHVLWHDRERDFGADPLRAHLAR